MWVVVEFVEESLVEAVPNLWIIEHDLVSWPGSAKPEQLKKMILKCVPPMDTWEKCQVRVLSRGRIYDNFLCATNAAKKAEYTSDINSDDGGRVKFPSRRILSSSEEEQDDDYIKDLPSYPTSLKRNKSESTGQGEGINRKIRDGPIQNTIGGVTKTNGRAISKHNDHRGNEDDHRGNEDDVDELLPSTSCSSATTEASIDNSQKEVNPRINLTTISTDGKKLCDDQLYDVDNTKLIRTLIHQFAQLNRKVDFIMNDLTTLINKEAVNNNTRANETAVMDQDFPINNMDELEQFESKLLDRNFYDNMVKFIQRIGGIDVNQFVKRSMSRILSNEVQCQLNWLGKRGQKKSFKNLQFCKALSDAILRNPSTKHATEMDIEKSVKNFIRHASDRMKSETRRQGDEVRGEN